MNRFELINELERVKRFDRTEEYFKEIRFLQAENKRLNDEIGLLHTVLTYTAHHFDALGQRPGFEMYLDVADDIRCNRLVSPPDFKRQSKRNVRDRREQAQGRRKKSRRNQKI